MLPMSMKPKPLQPTDPSLLMRFLEERIRRYRPPTRRGTPKGDPIGLSKKKYVATTLALLALSDTDVRQQARMLRVSYGVVRKWRSEDLFWQTVEGHAHAFMHDALLPYLRERCPLFKKQFDSGGNPHLPELNDVPRWGEPIQEAIGEALLTGLKEPVCTAMQMMLFLATTRRPQTEAKVLHAVISKAIGVLIDAKATMTDRQRVARMLKAILEQERET
jgi:hypothetical protein